MPMLGDKYPREVFSITATGRMVSPAVIQTMKHGKFTQASAYVWWAKTEKEFIQIKKESKGTIPMIWQKTVD